MFRNSLVSTLFLLAVILGFSACKSDQADMRKIITVLEVSVQATPQDTTIQPLLQQYNAYLKKYPKDTEWNSIYLYRAAQIYFRAGNYKYALELLEKADKTYGKAENNPNVLLFMASIYDEHLKDSKKAADIFARFATQYPEHPLKDKAKPEKVRLEEEIVSGSDEFYKDITNATLGQNLLFKYMTYTQKYPESDKTAEFLFNGAKLASLLKNHQRAINMFENIVANHPDYESAAHTLLLIGNEYENLTPPDIEKAKGYYQQFLTKYPNDVLAPDAKALLKNAGKSPEEILAGFEQGK